MISNKFVQPQMNRFVAWDGGGGGLVLNGGYFLAAQTTYYLGESWGGI